MNIEICISYNVHMSGSILLFLIFFNIQKCKNRARFRLCPNKWWAGAGRTAVVYPALVEVELGLNSISQTLEFQARPAPSAAHNLGLPPSLSSHLLPAVGSSPHAQCTRRQWPVLGRSLRRRLWALDQPP